MNAITAVELDAYDDVGMERLRKFVETATGGVIVEMERQVRWRPSWYAKLLKDGRTEQIYLRGDRTGDAAIFPDLKREADILGILERHGIPVPHVYGYCADPPCIVMETLPGTRDMASEEDAVARAAIGQEYIRAIAAMHDLPLDPFVEAGVNRPSSPEEIALVGISAYMPLYRRTKAKAEPLLEFAIGWMRRNVPANRTDARFVQFDCGQFLFDKGRLTGLYDFEFAMIADPMMDLATMFMREAVEPLGSPFEELCEEYARASGKAVDMRVVLFHTLQFATLGTMQFAGTVARGIAGDPHSIYLEWDISLREVIVIALSKLMGQSLPNVPALEACNGEQAGLIAKINDTLSSLKGAEPIDQSYKEQLQAMLSLLARVDSVGPAARDLDRKEIGALLGADFADFAEAEQALETHILQAPPEEDAALFQMLASMHARQFQIAAPTAIAKSAHEVTRRQSAAWAGI
ncbi:phosphotransferase family protein [Sphingobium sp. CFD-1]|uniref:phosphotransferase family protein n=1 Tax=Sphingobium sp. CFD-1 TaxID=2878545 RepID=UPI00214AD475|nr:phosphotransferase family protein [Sphingobium sp. CFD-1]